MAQAQRTIDRSSAAGRGERGQLRIGYFGTNIFGYLPSVINAFRTTVPDVEVILHTMSKFEQVDALRSNRLDVGVARYYPHEPDMAVETVGYESLLAALPASFAMGDERGISPEALCASPLILSQSGGRPSYADEIIRLLGNAGVTPKISQITDNIIAVLGLVASGIGVSIVPSSIAALKWPQVQFRSIKGAHTKVPIAMIYVRDSPRPATSAFVNFCLSEAGDVEAVSRS
ncbi:hypothetical protein BH11ARM1_BH11ARM1_18330 [soil metagenome]